MLKAPTATAPHTGMAWETSSGIPPSDQFRRVARLLELGFADLLLDTLLADGVVRASPERGTLDVATKRITTPASGYPLKMIVAGLPVIMYSEMSESRTATGGTTLTLVDNNLAAAQSSTLCIYWAGAYVIFGPTAANPDAVRQVSTWDNGTKTLTWATPLTNPVINGDPYTVTFFHITGLTNGAVNYVYAVKGTRTGADAVCVFEANTTGVAPASSILLMTITLSAAGVVTAYDYYPIGHSRTLYCNGLAGDEVVSIYTITSADPGETVRLTMTHDELLYFGGIEVTFSITGCVYTIYEQHDSCQVIIDVTLVGVAYPTELTVTLTRTGRKKIWQA